MMNQDAYARAGVNIAAGHEATQLMKTAVQATFSPAVLSDMGSFGGLYSAMALKKMTSPVLVASTDGVGTKTMVAAAMNRWHTIGQDIVNHSLNDILVQGARPLFFLDYVAASKLEPEKIAAVVGGAAKACREAGCALLAVHRSYLPEIRRLWSAGVEIRGLAHITGGGLIDNPPRIFPEGLGAALKHGSWPVPPIFHLIQQLGRLPDAEMHHVFNMGLGMLVIVPPKQAELAQKTLGNDVYQIGEMVEGEKKVKIS